MADQKLISVKMTAKYTASSILKDAMKQLIKRVSLLLLLNVNGGVFSYGQEGTPEALWLLPGIDWQATTKIRWRNQLGYNHYLKTGIVYSQGYFEVHKNIVLNPAYIYSLRKNSDNELVREHYLMNAIIIQAKKKRFFFDSRNMLWNRIATGSAARHYYRNRIRAMYTFKVRSMSATVYSYDEIFFQLSNWKLSRNRGAIGIYGNVLSNLNIDFTYVRQWDRYIGSLNLFFVATVWQLKRKK